MRAAQLTRGRTFVLRLEEGEVLHETIESFCRDNSVVNATLSLVGAVDSGSVMVSGPSFPVEDIIVPETLTLDRPCEFTGVGTVFPDTDGNPTVHIHGSVGRVGFSATGDMRPGMVVWLVMEVVIDELVGTGPVRMESDPRLKGKILEIERWHRRRSSGRRFTTRTVSRSRNSRTFRVRS